MKVIVPHNKPKQEVINTVDRAASDLFATAAGPVQLVDQKKNWAGSTMNFSFTGKMGFISVPMSGTVEVDDRNVTVDVDLPPMVKQFLGEEKIKTQVEQRVKGLLA